MAQRNKTFAEFFAGIGLVHRALAPGGWRCVYANDIDPKKQRMYLDAFGASPHFHLEDLWRTDEILAAMTLPAAMATASFPCTDLSTAGRYAGLAGAQSSAFFAFTAVLERLADTGRAPELLLIENVPALMTSNEGRDFASAAGALAALGYWLDALVLDARHFTPQSRPRLFLIGMRAQAVDVARAQLAPRDTLWPGPAPLEASVLRPARLVARIRQTELATGWVHLAAPTPPVRRRSLASVIDDDDRQDWWPVEQVEKHLAMMDENHSQRVHKLRRTRGRHVLTIFRRKRKGKTRCECRFDGLAGCLRTPKGGSARQIVAIIDAGETKMRWMSPREYARLQGADDFPIDVAASAAMFGFGDAVCVPAIRWLDQHLLSPLAEGLAATAAP